MKDQKQTMCKEACTCKNEKAENFDGCSCGEVEQYGYYSKVLQKPFDTLDELKEAEYKFKLEQDEKFKAKETRRQAVEDVKAVITARVEVENRARQAKIEALKIYTAAIKEADKAVQEAKKREAQILTDFCTKYPEGFHETIQLGKSSWRVDYSLNVPEKYFDPFIDFFKLF